MPKGVADRTFKKLIAVSLCVMMALSGVMVLWNGNSDGIGETAPVRIFVNNANDLQVLESQDVDIVESYGGFVIANLDTNQLQRLEYRGLTVIPEVTLHTVAMEGFEIDTREGEPALPAGLHIDEYEFGSDGRYIVQFIGPVKEEWKIALSNLGVEVGDYLPYNSFIVKMNTQTLDKVSDLRFVQWVGVFQPAYRVRPSLWEQTGPIGVEIVTFDGKGVNSVLARLSEYQVFRDYAGEDFGVVKAWVTTSDLVTLANLNAVSYIEPYYVEEAYNEFMQWTIQTNITNDRKLWNAGIDGTGQVIALADTGLDYDHPAFRENVTDIVKGDIYNVTDMSRRKLVRYLTMAQYVGVDPWSDFFAYADSSIEPFQTTMGHGTMMAGIAAANDNYMDISPNDGGALNAKLIMQDVANVCDQQGQLDDCFTFIPDDYDLFFGPVYNEGARIHSNSWGTSEEVYDLESRMVDKFVFEHPDFFITWSAGNGGPTSGDPHTSGSPSNAKDVVSVGWVGSPSPLIPTDQNSVSGQGSTGPTPDGRMKPELVMIGEGMSTISDGDPWSDVYVPDDLIFGTSYGSPATAAMGAMARQYYEDGFYPTGTAHPAGAWVPSAALVKALLMASGERATQGFRDSRNEQRWPNNSQGWGRPLLDNVLYFPGDDTTSRSTATRYL
jgi:subtilisin family serine protease